MSVIDALTWRYAVREFSNKEIPAQDIHELADATRLTASSYGLQPYKLVVVESREMREALLPHAMGQTKVLDSSHLFILASNNEIDDHFIEQYFAMTARVRGVDPQSVAGFKQHVKDVILGMPKGGRKQWADQQAFIALGNLLTVAALKGIDACPMGGFDAEGFDEVLGLKDKGLRSCVICALGYRSEYDSSAQAKKIRVDFDNFMLRV
ncbi:NAD(P)H-dependent oxidoreductase [Paraglaciecola arctica]|uniref:NAD(P)H-dependent oxidoreductase n=1 Tax=Paraglaciecola arctica TaxID=1128911 RepID=UPI001C065D62|nr:NAD(P)H-dependent oxidoreductase [Paraglaciecola arctica]MBU3005320.1 NAD(P)H-dependent oxidoreductase [Paraglaciecola arctica]